MALKGQLQDLSVKDLIMINCFGNARACVKLISNSIKAEIYFDNGDIIDAHYETTSGLDALYKALSLTEGKYQVELGLTSLEHSIQGSWKDIIKGWSSC